MLTSASSDKAEPQVDTWQFWRPPWSLRTALIVFALSVVAPTLAVFALQYRATAVEKQDELERQLRQLTRSVAADVGREIAIKRAQAVALSTSRALKDRDFAAFRVQAETALRNNPGWLVVFRADGTQLMHTRIPVGEPLPYSRIPDVIARVAATGAPEESDVFDNNIDGGFSVATLTHVGDTDMVLSGTLPADHLNRVLAAPLPQGWVAGLTDRTGRTIARSHKPEPFVGQPATPEYWRRVSAEPVGTITLPTLDGIASHTHWIRLDNGWTVGVSVPIALLHQPMRAWERQFYLSLILFAILASIGAIFGSHAIALSMRQLAGRARSIGSRAAVPPLSTMLREVNEFGDVLSQASRERQRAEAALHESDRRFRAMFNQDTAGMSVVECDGRFTAANRRLCEITGYTEVELRGKTIYDITHPADVPANTRLVAGVIRDGASYAMEKRLIRKDGRAVWTQVSSMPVLDDDGRVQYVLGIVLDIDDRKRAAMENARLAAIVTSSGDAIKSLSLDGTILTWNEAAERLYGYKAAEAIGQSIDLIVPTDRSDEFFQMMAAARVGQVGRLDTVRRHRSGALISVSLDVAPIRDLGGAVIGISTLAHDITERRRIDAALREGEARLAGVIESAIDAIISVDESHRIVLFNPAAEQMFGTPAADAIGSLLQRFIPERFQAEHDRHMSRFAETKVTSRRMGALGAITGRRADGEEFPIEASISQIDVADKRIFTVILRDISARMRAELALQQSEQQFRTLTNSIPQLAWMAKPDGWVAWYNDRWYEYTGTTPEQMEGWGWQSVYDAAALPAVLERWKHSLDTGEPFDMTISLKGIDGNFRPFLTRALPLRDPQGHISCWFGTNTDITAQKEHEAHLNFVMRELSHRSKNLLAVVQAMARQTMRHSVGFDDFESRFTGRLLGLARSHDLLVRGDWTGASIRDLVRTQLAAFVPDEFNNLDLEGEDITLTPEAVQNLGFALFELATNAVKYGALSVPTGRVIVSWKFVEGGDDLRFVWREVGGPQVAQPVRKGFGTVVIERFMSTAFGGVASSEFDRDGFRWTLDIPGKHLTSRRPRTDWPWRQAQVG